MRPAYIFPLTEDTWGRLGMWEKLNQYKFPGDILESSGYNSVTARPIELRISLAAICEPFDFD